MDSPGLQGTDMKGMTRNTPDNFGMYRAVTLLEPIVKGQYKSSFSLVLTYVPMTDCSVH